MNKISASTDSFARHLCSENELIPYHSTDLTGRKVLLLAPHPDDETLGCGGTLCLHAAAEDPVKIVVLTNGVEGNPALNEEQDKDAYVLLRKEEAMAACSSLGITDVEFWFCEDRQLLECEGSVERLTELLQDYRPELVYVPSPFEFHPDHRAASLLLEAAIKRSVDMDFTVAFYEIGQPIRINTLVDITPVMEGKKKAIACYPSQLRVKSYNDIGIALNRFRSMTLPDDAMYAEGFFLCPAEQIRISKAFQVIQRDGDRLLSAGAAGEKSQKTDENNSLQVDAGQQQDLPLVSIILPTCNRPERLRRAIESILAQTYQQFELIVVNDGGEDISDIVEALNGSGKIRLLQHAQRLGVSAARNVALRAAQGKYIAYLDDDDFYYPHHLQTLIEALEKNVYQVVYTDSYKLLQTQKENQWITVEKQISYGIDFDRTRLLLQNYIPTLTVCHRSEILEETGYFDESLKYHEDWDLWIRFSSFYYFYRIPKITAAWTEQMDQPSLGRNKPEISKTLKLIYQKYFYSFIPGCDRYHRYAFLQGAAENKTVLDLFCGEGEGSFFLSQKAKWVFGMESDEKKVSISASRYAKENLVFVKAARNRLPLKNGIDLAICFPPSDMRIERFKKIVEEVKKVLNPGGKIFVASQNLKIESFLDTSDIKFDPKDLFFEQQEVLSANFGHLLSWGQRSNCASNIFPVPKSMENENQQLALHYGDKSYFSHLDSRGIVSHIFGASDQSIEEDIINTSSFLFDDRTCFHRYTHLLIEHLVGRLAEKDDYIETTIHEKNHHIENLETIILNKEEYLEKFVSEKERHISNLATIISDKEEYLEKFISDTEQHISNLETTIANKEGFLERFVVEKEQHIENLESILSNKEEYLERFVADKEQHIENLEKIINNKEAYIEKAIPEKDRHIANLEEIIASKDEKIEDIENRILDQIHRVGNIEEDLKRLESDRQNEKEFFNRQIYDKEVHIHNIESELNLIRNSRVWRWAERFRRVFYNRLLGPFPFIRNGVMSLSLKGIRPFLGKARSYLRRNKESLALGLLKTDYDNWMEKNDLSEEEIRNLSANTEHFEYRPTISILMPVYDVDQIWLEKAIASVLQQVYPNWELCIADDASPGKHIKKILKKYEKKNKRIKVIYLPENKGISGATNAALSLAGGEYIALLDNDDELSRDALYECVKLLNQHRDADLIYSDEDKIDIRGRRIEPFFKPDYSPDLLLSMNYICHFSIFRRSLIDDIGGFRTGYEGSQDYDLLLRFIERTSPEKVFHIPKILYHWRKIPGSAAAVADAKSYAFTAAKKALADYLERNGIKGEVSDGIFLGSYRIQRAIIDEKKVSIIIPFRDQAALLEKCVESLLEKTVYSNYEVLLVNNRSRQQETFALLERLRDQKKIRIMEYERPFNFSAINNQAVRQATGEYVLLLNNDMEIVSGDWLHAMVEHAQREAVGVVGAKLLYPNHRIQHAGVVMGIGIASHAFSHLPVEDNGYFGLINVIRNYCAVTGACLMMRKSVYESLGGMDETYLGVAYNDVDLCLKAVEKGYFVVYTPYAQLFHHESASRGNDNEEGLADRDPEKFERVMAERRYMEERWGKFIANDPFYNPNLTRNRNDYSLRS